MTDYKGCDVHKHGFPNNLVPAENVYTIEISQPATINGKKGTKILRVDVCHEDAKEKLFDAMSALKVKPKWIFSYWGKYQKDDGTEGRKTFEEELDVAYMEKSQPAK